MASSVSGISPVSMNAISSVRPVGIRPQNFAVENESEVSDAFAESLAANGASGITGPAPVQYTNAQAVSDRSDAIRDRAAESTRVNQYYNDVASSFEGAPTSYDANGQAASYGVVGSTIDLIA